MKGISNRAAGVVAAGVLGLGALVAAAPALAGAGPFAAPAPASTAPGPGYGMGHGMGMGNGAGMGYGTGMGAGYGMGTGTCPGLGVTAEKGTLTTAQRATLASMAQEEKLAHDLYASFAARSGTPVFGHIAMSESHHLSAVRTLLQRYGVTDPTAGQAAGRFTDPAVQATYDRLLAQGTASPAAALGVGQQVERDDIAKLKDALGGLTAPDVQQLYTALLAASQQHLAAFSR